MEASPFTIIATLVNFIILMFVLKKILFARVNKIIEDRNHHALDIIESAEHTKKEAMKVRESLELQINDLEEQGRGIIKEAKVKADEQAKDILKEAENHATEIRKKTELELERQKKLAINSMRQEIGEMAIYATEKILEKQLDHNEQQIFIGKVIEAGTDKMAELTDKTRMNKNLGKNVDEANDSILEEMKYIGSLLREEPEFHELLKTPAISTEEKKELIRNVFEGRISTETYDFLRMYVDFQYVVEEELKISAGTIYSVEPLTEDQLSSFEKKAGRLINQRVRLINKLDSSLLGGVKIIVDDKIIDASIRKRLQDLEGSIKRI